MSVTARLLHFAREAIAARLQSDDDIVSYGQTIYYPHGGVLVIPEITRGDVALAQLNIGH